jgi:hypothetical protein
MLCRSCSPNASPLPRGGTRSSGFNETPSSSTGVAVISSFKSSITEGSNRSSNTPGSACSLPCRRSCNPQASRPPWRSAASRIRSLSAQGKPTSVPSRRPGSPTAKAGRPASCTVLRSRLRIVRVSAPAVATAASDGTRQATGKMGLFRGRGLAVNDAVGALRAGDRLAGRLAACHCRCPSQHERGSAARHG